MLEISCCHRLKDAEAFREAINALNLASSKPDPFSTFEFYEHYVGVAERFRSQVDFRLWLLLAFDDGRLLGYLALRQRTRRVLGLRSVKLDLLGAYTAGRPHLVCLPQNAATVSAAMYAYLLRREADWSLLEFPQQDAASVLLPPPAAANAGLFRLRSWENPPHGPIPLGGTDSLAEYFAALSHKMRSNVSRQMRNLMAAGEVELLSSSDPQTVDALYALYRSIEPYSWKAKAGAHIGRNPQSIAYYLGLMGSQRPMHIIIQVLLLDGVPVAGLINSAFDQGLYALEIVFDDRYADLAPGSAMLLFGVRLAIESGCEFYDLLWGFAYNKHRWQADMQETSCVQIYRVDRPYFWHRVVGDWLRRWLPRADTVGRSRFNPLRRLAGRMSIGSPALSPTAATRADTDEMLAAVLRGCGEFLSASQLSELLPFPTVAADQHPDAQSRRHRAYVRSLAESAQ